jgi:copper transport protein
VFAIGAPSADPVTMDRPDPSVAAALWLCKLVLYLGVFVGVGGSFFRAWLAPRHRIGSTILATLAGLVAALLAVGLQGADALGVPPEGLARATVWRTGFETSFGPTVIAAACALLAGLLSLQAPLRRARGLALFGLLAAGLALALSGHAGAAAPQWLTRPAVFVHAVTVAFWVGSLVPLAAALRTDAGSAVLAAFSRAIPWALAPLVVTGTVLAVIQVEQPELLLTTAYGRLLCVKLLLVALLLLLAAWNRYRLTPAISAGHDEAHRLRRIILFELAIVAAILGVVAAWRFTPPPRALAIAAAQPAFVHVHTADAMAEVTLQPGRAGLVRADIIIMNGEFGGLDAREVTLTFANAAAGIEPISRPARKGADAIWRVEEFPVPRGGRWDVRVDILVNDFEKLRLDGQIDVRAK